MQVKMKTVQRSMRRTKPRLLSVTIMPTMTARLMTPAATVELMRMTAMVELMKMMETTWTMARTMSVTAELRIITMGVTTSDGLNYTDKTEVLYEEDSILTDIVSSSVEELES